MQQNLILKSRTSLLIYCKSMHDDITSWKGYVNKDNILQWRWSVADNSQYSVALCLMLLKLRPNTLKKPNSYVFQSAHAIITMLSHYAVEITVLEKLCNPFASAAQSC